MKIAVYLPKTEIPPDLQSRLARLGQISYTRSRRELTRDQLSYHAHGALILALDPDNFGGFEKASDRVRAVLEANHQVKGIALFTTSYGWIDTQYCRKRGITVMNIPGYSREAVAEHTLALLLCLAKRIIATDRKTRENRYRLEMGFELAGKTLGIIGLGNIGSRVAELGQAIGMKVIAYNRSPRDQAGVEMVSLNQLWKRADAISLHVRDNPSVRNMINRSTIKLMKPGVIIVNTVGREVMDEAAIAPALKSGRIGAIAYEGENLTDTPLADIDNAVGLKGFGWYTREAIANLFRIAVENIEAMATGKPTNVVN